MTEISFKFRKKLLKLLVIMTDSKRSSASARNDNNTAQSSEATASSKTNKTNILPKNSPNSSKRSSSTPRNEKPKSADGYPPTKTENTSILSKSPADYPNENLDNESAAIETAQVSAVAAAAMSPKEANVESPSNSSRSPRVSLNKNVVTGAALGTKEQHATKQSRLQYFRSGTDADCEVHVPKIAEQEGGNVCYKKFRCHRIFLATASEKLEQDVFQNSQWNGILQINGVSPESVEIFLEYIYTFEITSSLVDLRIMGDIYILSSAYNMPEFLQSFSKRLKDIDWPLSDIFPAFNLAFQHNLLELESDCLGNILKRAAELKTQPSIMKLQIYAFNYLIQHWMVTEALTTNELIQLLQQYQRENDLNFKNTKQFPHFTKIVKYFPDVLLDAEGLIYIS